MPPQLEIHAASPEEQAAAFRNFHDVWGSTPDVNEHVRQRLSAPKHKNAQWYVGCLEGKVVSGCGCYSFELCIDGQRAPACAFGEVHTLAEFRGRGFAPQLIAFVENEQRAAGKRFSLLYSDIDPRYYERLGYSLCASPEGWGSPAEGKLGDATMRLVAVDGKESLSQLSAMYERYHRQFPWWVSRSESYWKYLLARSPGDAFFLLNDAKGQTQGYLRAVVTNDELKIRDFALASSDGELLRSLFAAALDLGRERNISRVGGWMPRLRLEGYVFRERPRELTMLKPLHGSTTVSEPLRQAGQFLHEIDHV